MRCITALMGFMLAFALVACASAGVDYLADPYMHKAPRIVAIAPYDDQVTINAPGGLNDSRIIFANAFGQYLSKPDGSSAIYTHQTFKPGETKTYDVHLSDHMGNVEFFCDYYNLQTKQDVAGIPNIGSHHNDDLAAWNNVNYLAGNHVGQIYIRGENGVWGWTSGRPVKNAASAFLSGKEFVPLYAA